MSEKVDRAREVISDGLHEAVAKIVVELRHHRVSNEEAVKGLKAANIDLSALFTENLK
jgi:hypothetical protein